MACESHLVAGMAGHALIKGERGLCYYLGHGGCTLTEWSLHSLRCSGYAGPVRAMSDTGRVLTAAATMAFSRFILKLGICSTSFSELYLPTCPLLTFDLILLHLLSITTLSLLLVILSIALSPGYHLSLSDMEAGSKADPESMDAFVMWDLALASPPTSPRVEEPNPFSPRTLRSYGTVTPVPVMGSESYPQPGPSAPVTSPTPVLKTKDKFAEGRLWSYIPLLACSLGGCGASSATLVKAQSRYSE